MDNKGTGKEKTTDGLDDVRANIVNLISPFGYTSFLQSSTLSNVNFKLPNGGGISGQLLQTDGFGNTFWGSGAGTGFLSSVGLTAPSPFTIVNSPLTSNGNIDITFSGIAIPISSGGTGLTSVGSNGTVLSSNGTNLVYSTPTTGTVTSVNVSVPSVFSATGGPVTSTGTIALTYSGTALPVANGGTGVTTSSGASSVVLRDSSQNISVNQLTSTVSAGTAPLVVTSSTIVGNLNVNYLNGVGFNTPAVNRAVELDSSAQFVTATITGTGSYVKSTSPSLTTPNIGSASGTNLNLSGLTASQAVATDASKNLVSVATTGTGSFVLAANPTLTGTFTADTGTFSGNVTAASYVGVTTSFSSQSTVDMVFDTTMYRKVIIDFYVVNSISGGNIFLYTAAGTPDSYSSTTRKGTSTLAFTDGTLMNGPETGVNGGTGTITIYRPVTATTGYVYCTTTALYYYTGTGPATTTHFMTFTQSYTTTLRLFRDNGNMTGSYTIRNFS